MNFEEALPFVKKGYIARRKAWDGKTYLRELNDQYVQFNSNGKNILIISPKYYRGTDDWEVYEKLVIFYTIEEMIPLLKAGKTIGIKDTSISFCYYGKKYKKISISDKLAFYNLFSSNPSLLFENPCFYVVED